MKRTLLASFLAAAAAVTLHAALRDDALERLLETGDTAAARARIENVAPEALRHYWESKARFYQGDYAGGEAEIARASSAKEEEENEFRALERYFHGLAQLSAGFQVYESEHFRFKAKGIDQILAPYALETLEKAYAEIGADLGCLPADKIIVEVYPDKQEFSYASTLPEEVIEKSGTVGICKFNRLMLLSPRALPLGFTWRDTLAHEYTHLLVGRVSGARCPLWLHEGIARYQETRWRLKDPAVLSAAGETQLAGALKKKKLITFKRMHPSLVYLDNQDDISLAFAEVASAVRYLKEKFGSGSLERLLKAIAAGGEEKGFAAALRRSPLSFEHSWTEYLGTLSLASSPGAINDQASFTPKTEEEYIGADQRGLIRLGDQLRALGRSDAALVHYEKALAAEPANPAILLKIARACIARGDTAGAEERLLKAIEKNPQYVTPYQVLGEMYFKAGDYVKAKEVFERALGINPFHPASHRTLSRCCLALSQGEEALRELQISVLLDPADGESRVLFDRLK